MPDKRKGEVVANPVAYDQLLSHLLYVGEALLGETRGVFDRLAQEMALVTHGQVQLVLQEENSEQPPLATPPCIPVQFNGRFYGMLCIALDPADHFSPAIPWTMASPLARLCGRLLYDIELAAILLELRQPSTRAYQAPISLSDSEAEVLALTCQGSTTQQIATRLRIVPATVRKHREHIYAQFGTHSVHETIFAAFATGLFYPIDDVRPRIMPAKE
jgi:DNA-binding CsgD family transcriptional regulator